MKRWLERFIVDVAETVEHDRSVRKITFSNGKKHHLNDVSII